jgi:hypothetical protein
MKKTDAFRTTIHNAVSSCVNSADNARETQRRWKAPGRRKTMDGIVIEIIAATSDTPRGKLADAELHFAAGPLGGLKFPAKARAN